MNNKNLHKERSATEVTSIDQQKMMGYEKPQLKQLGNLVEVTQKTGGQDDGGAAMMKLGNA